MSARAVSLKGAPSMLTRGRRIAASIIPLGLVLVGCTGPLAHKTASRPHSSSTTAPSSPPASTTTTTEQPSVLPTDSIEPLFIGNGVAVVVDDSLASSGCSTVFASSDFTHWRSIDPPQQSTGSTPGEGGTCPDVWQSASFVSPNQGWILGRNGGDVSTLLFHTVDGGRSWTEEPGSTTGSNGGTQSIGFTSADDGWRQQFATGSNGPYLLETTSDGGNAWRAYPQTASNGGCEWAQDVFANPDDGFAGATFGTGGADQGGLVATPKAWLWQTSDGGETWHQMTTAPPPSLADAAAFYDLPTFFNTSSGILPVQYSTTEASTLDFYASPDAGQSWHLSASVPEMSTAQSTANAGSCGTQVVGTLPMVSLASVTTWWVIDASDANISITTDGGHSWTTMRGTNLGFMHRNGNVVQSFNALNSSIAWVSISNVTTGTQLWQTTDGGQTWAQVTAASLEAAVTATALPSCANAQLSVAPGRSGVGLGHVGEALLFTNVSQAGCTLYGYPGVAALDSSGDQIAQAVRTPNGYIGGILPSSGVLPLVTLSPGHSASAMVEGTDDPLGPGPDPPPCPIDSGLLVTVPNTTHSVRLPPGPTLCSGLQIHPVVPGISGNEND